MDEGPFEDRSVMGRLMEELMNWPLCDINRIAEKYGCSAVKLEMPEDKMKYDRVLVCEMKSFEEDEDEEGNPVYEPPESEWKGIPREHFAVLDATGKEICTMVMGYRGTDEDGYGVCEIRYVGDPRGERVWKKMMEELKYIGW